MSKRRHRIVPGDGVASAGELQGDYESALRRLRETEGAAPSTIEALMYELRTYGAAALAGANCQRRVSELSPKQVQQVIVRLNKLRPNYPAITDNLLLLLAELIP